MNNDINDEWLSLKPEAPSPAQCCGGGCSPCVYDLYQAKLELWEKAKERDDPDLLRQISDQNRNVLSPETFTECELCGVEPETEDTARYRFQLPPGATLGLTLGQHLVLRGAVNGVEIQRAYTPISSIHARGHFEVLIKVYECGLMSQYIKHWRQGDGMAWRGPFGGFLYKPNQYGELLMLCSGTGIAPMLPILTHVTDNEEDETFLTLVVCARNFQNVYMKNFLKEQSRYWNVRMFYVLSQEQSFENLPMSYKENSKLGRIDSVFLAKVLETCRRKPYSLICGSVSFTEDVTYMLTQLKQDDTSNNEEDETFLTLVVCARNFQNVYMKNFLKEQSRYWNVRMFYVLSQEQSFENLPMSYKENSKLGRIDSVFLAKVLETCRRKPYSLICGSVSFTEDVTYMLTQLKQDDTSIFSF